MEHFRQLIATFFAGILAYLSPLTGDFISLICVFGLNFCAGLFTDLLINGTSFKFRKAFHCIKEATIFMILVCAIYFIGDHKGSPQGALQCISLITYSLLYFYSVNILKNMIQLCPVSSVGYKAVSFLYYIVSIEFAKHIPGLTNYLNKDHDEN